MIPGKLQKKKDDEAPADQENAMKKGTAMIHGGTMGMGRNQPSSDKCSGDPDLNINTAMQMMAQPLRF